MEVHITTHSGKMEGIRSISTNPLSNVFCETMHKSSNKCVICTHCYAHTYALMRPSLKMHLQNNSELLSKAVLLPSVLPKYSDRFMRFNSFGELINVNHLVNLFSICNNNPQTTHVLYSKRMNLIEQMHDFVPRNLIIIESNPMVNAPILHPRSWAANYVFNVVTKRFVEERMLPVTCIKNCYQCQRCYTFGNTRSIIEVLK